MHPKDDGGADALDGERVDAAVTGRGCSGQGDHRAS
jgi:hypothetical protein